MFSNNGSLWCVVLRWFGSVIIFCCTSGSKINGYSMEIRFIWLIFLVATENRNESAYSCRLSDTHVMQPEKNNQTTERARKRENVSKKCISIISHFVDCNAAKLVLTKWFILTPFQLHHGEQTNKHNATNVEQYFTLWQTRNDKAIRRVDYIQFQFIIERAIRINVYGECNFSNYGFINWAFVYDYFSFCHKVILPHQ